MNHRTLQHLLTTSLLLLSAGCASSPDAPATGSATSAAISEETPEQTTASPDRPDSSPLVIRPDYPERYVVKRGDTLWEIAGRFLRDPWRWPELWQKNPQIANPHLIYPGDVLTLTYIDGRPVMQVQRPSAPEPTPPPEPKRRYEEVRLSPTVRVEPIERAIPSIPAGAINQFLLYPRVVTDTEYETAPYVLSVADERLMGGSGNVIYARGVSSDDYGTFELLRRGQAYRNPEDRNDILGWEAIHVADADVQRFGDPATLVIKSNNREVLQGDRLFPPDMMPVPQNFQPRAPRAPVEGEIIAVIDGVSQIGQYQVVAINAGLRDDLEVGNVLAVMQRGDLVRDPVRTGEEIRLPDQRAGILMVFKTLDRMSFAIVMEATRVMFVGDEVTNP